MLYKSGLNAAAYEIPLYLGYNFMSRRSLNALPCISLCKMKHFLVGPF